MPKHKMTLSNLTGVITPPSDEIPVVIRYGSDKKTTASSLRWLDLHAGPGLLEANVQWVILTREQITIYLRPKDYNTSVEVK